MAKTTTWKLRLAESELADWKAMAAEDGVTLSEWVRRCCNNDEPMVLIEGQTTPSNPVVFQKRNMANVPENAPIRHAVAHHPTCGCRSCELQNK